MKITSEEIDRAFESVRQAGVQAVARGEEDVPFSEAFRAMVSGSQIPALLVAAIASIGEGQQLAGTLLTALVTAFLAGRKSMENEREK